MSEAEIDIILPLPILKPLDAYFVAFANSRQDNELSLSFLFIIIILLFI